MTDAAKTPFRLPTERYDEVPPVIAYARTHGLMLTVEMDPGAFDCDADEADDIYDELAPGESFTVLAVMTMEDYADKQEREDAALGVAAYERKLREEEKREEEKRERAAARARVVQAITPPTLVDALGEFARCMGAMEVGAEHLTCSEADAVAGVLRAVGYGVEADKLLSNHADADDEGDPHYELRSTASLDD